MIIPKLRKQRSSKNYHGLNIEDDYSWVDQPDIIEVLQKPEKLLPEVKKFLNENNKLTDEYFKDSKDLQKKLFVEIKSKIKLADETLKYKDKQYYYWSKTTKTGNYSKSLRQKIGSEKIEIYFDGDKEKKLSGSKYFDVGAISISPNDELMAYSLDLKGSEYYDILIRNLNKNKIIDEKIPNTAGSITWSLDNKSFFYISLDKYHRSRKIYKHTLGTSIKEDIYDVHYLQIQNSGNVTDNRRLTCRFFEGGVLETAGVYHIATQVGTSAGTFSDVKGTTENEMRLCDNTGGNSAGEKANVYAYFYNLGNSSKYSLMLSQSIVGNNTGTASMEFGGGYLPQASTVDGIRVLINDDSNFDSFTMTLYGMKQL